MKHPTRRHKLPTAINQCHLLGKIRSMYHYQTHAAAALEFLHRGISLCHTVFAQGLIPDQGEGQNGGTLSLHISWSVKTVDLSASTRYLHD